MILWFAHTQKERDGDKMKQITLIILQIKNLITEALKHGIALLRRLHSLIMRPINIFRYIAIESYFLFWIFENRSKDLLMEFRREGILTASSILTKSPGCLEWPSLLTFLWSSSRASEWSLQPSSEKNVTNSLKLNYHV